MDLSIIIVNWNTRALLQDCLRSLVAATQDLAREIFVVDNGSGDGSQDMVRREFGAQVTLIENRENRGFARANNQALQQCCGRCVVLLNSDTVVRPGALQGLMRFLDAHPQAAMVGPQMVDDDGRVQNSFDNFPGLLTELLNKSLLRLLFPGRFAGKAGTRTGPFEVDSLIGACLAVRRAAIEQVGLLDEGYFFFLEETDWCLRMRRAGWGVYHDPRLSIVHLQGRSKRRRPGRAWVEYYRSLYRYFKKNHRPAAYAALRVFRFVKLTLNLVLTALGLCLTVGLKKRYREKLQVYAWLVWWHVRLCPPDSGLRGRSAASGGDPPGAAP